jgi:cupin fold WbuC family metalloprotein
MNNITYVDDRLLDELCGEAAASARRRKNRNFHGENEAPCNRLLNAVEPDSYIRPHRHNEITKGETFIVVRGRLALFFFDDEGRVRDQRVLGPATDCCGVDIAPGTWHGAIALESGTVFFEAKAGPYKPLEVEETAPWAPAEGDEDCQAYLQQLRSRVTGAEKNADAACT